MDTSVAGCDNPSVLLLRLATVRLTAPPPRSVASGPHVASNGVAVSISDVRIPVGSVPPVVGPGPTVIWPYEHDQTCVMVQALVDAGPAQVRDGRLLVPAGPRAAAEEAISEFADLLAIVHQCRRSLRSPRPAVALGPGGTGGGPPLGVAGLVVSGDVRGGARLMPPTEPVELARWAADRPDGVAMLADALSEDSAIGRVRELFRLFERAFRTGPSACVEPLSAFLASAPRHDATAYGADEVREWMERLRPEAVHADRRDAFARAADAAPFLPRMEAAAYDVLLHKATWRDRSPTRRLLVDFMSVPGPASGDPVLLLRAGATIMIDWLDPFGVYPTDWQMTAGLDANWVWRLPGQEDSNLSTPSEGDSSGTSPGIQ
jgi:hypothetical protein